MAKPVRIQRLRTKGWRMPENTVYVGRPTLFGNPWVATDAPSADAMALAKWCVEQYRLHELDELVAQADWSVAAQNHAQRAIADRGGQVFLTMRQLIREELRGKNLACWCPAGTPCHADVLLEVASS